MGRVINTNIMRNNYREAGMREYRGKDYKTGEWVTGGLTDGWEIPGEYFPMIEELRSRTLNRKRVAEETVGQYTGLTDSKGAKIFEGDIVSCAGFLYIVRFGSYNKNPENCAPAYTVGFYLEIIKDSFDSDTLRGRTGELYDIDGRAARFPAYVVFSPLGIPGLLLEVIGNIHDDKNLLEGTG
jgi:hypothetical protein